MDVRAGVTVLLWTLVLVLLSMMYIRLALLHYYEHYWWCYRITV